MRYTRYSRSTMEACSCRQAFIGLLLMKIYYKYRSTWRGAHKQSHRDLGHLEFHPLLMILSKQFFYFLILLNLLYSIITSLASRDMKLGFPNIPLNTQFNIHRLVVLFLITYDKLFNYWKVDHSSQTFCKCTFRKRI